MAPPTPFDVVIAGAGPAGCAAAIALARRGRAVALVVGPAVRRERLVESLAPLGRRLLDRIGVDSASVLKRQRPMHVLKSAWGRDELSVTDLAFHPYGHAWLVDRSTFDAALLHEAERHGAHILRDSAVRHVELDPNARWRIHVDSGADLQSRWLIDATGRAALIARRLTAVPRTSARLIALWTELPSATPGEPAYTLVESCPDGWWFSASLSKQRMAIALFTAPDRPPCRRRERFELWSSALREAVHTRRRAASVVPHALFAAVADTTRLSAVTGTGWTAIGDAAFALDPLSSFGLCQALESAAMAAAGIDRALDGDPTALVGYQTLVDRRFEESDRIRLSFYAAERRFRTILTPPALRFSSDPFRAAKLRNLNVTQSGQAAGIPSE